LKIYSIILSVAALCFLAGYQFALFNNPIALDNSPAVKNSRTEFVEKNRLEKRYTDIDMQDYPEEVVIEQSNVSKLSVNNSILTTVNNIDDIDIMLANIETLKVQQGNANLIGKQFDLFKQFLINNPDHLDYTVEYLDAYSVDDPRFNLLISAIQSIPEQGADQALFALAKQYGMSSDPQSQKKFVALVASASTMIETEEIIQGLLELTIIEQVDMNTKLEALNLLQPFQIKESEKENIIKGLTADIYNSNGSEAEMLLPHVMRFAIDDQGEQIVTELLAYTSSDSLRLAVLDNISAGSIPISDEIKNMLLEIAKSESDPLNSDAKNALIERFNISYSEYSTL